MATTQYDIGYLEAANESLESFLTSRHLFWPINSPSPLGEPAYPRLTIGGVLLARVRLNASRLSPHQQDNVERLENLIEKISTKWRNAWIRKATREYKSRLNQWAHYLNELKKEPNNHIDYYLYEVKVRVMIDLLIPEMDKKTDAFYLPLKQLDSLLKTFFIPNSFLWDKELKSGFNPQTYWYLWGYPDINLILMLKNQ